MSTNLRSKVLKAEFCRLFRQLCGKTKQANFNGFQLGKLLSVYRNRNCVHPLGKRLDQPHWLQQIMRVLRPIASLSPVHVVSAHHRHCFNQFTQKSKNRLCVSNLRLWEQSGRNEHLRVYTWPLWTKAQSPTANYRYQTAYWLAHLATKVSLAFSPPNNPFFIDKYTLI